MFLFTDSHVADEGFLELINNMLTSGMVPALYDSSEKDALTGSLHDAVTKAGLVPTKETCWSFFVQKCRDNLHIVLAMSPVGSTHHSPHESGQYHRETFYCLFAPHTVSLDEF